MKKIFECISAIEHLCILIKMSLKLVLIGLGDISLSLVLDEIGRITPEIYRMYYYIFQLYYKLNVPTEYTCWNVVLVHMESQF